MASDIETTPGRRPREDAGSATSGARYPRWYWPSFTLPGLLWLLLFFVLPFYVVLSVAFGTVDPLFRNPLPVYQPWWWSFDTFVDDRWRSSSRGTGSTSTRCSERCSTSRPRA